MQCEYTIRIQWRIKFLKLKFILAFAFVQITFSNIFELHTTIRVVEQNEVKNVQRPKWIFRNLLHIASHNLFELCSKLFANNCILLHKRYISILVIVTPHQPFELNYLQRDRASNKRDLSVECQVLLAMTSRNCQSTFRYLFIWRLFWQTVHQTNDCEEPLTHTPQTPPWMDQTFCIYAKCSTFHIAFAFSTIRYSFGAWHSHSHCTAVLS